MMTKEEYKKEIVRMFNSLRDDRLKEDDDCSGVQCCEQCALYGIDCGNSTKAFEMIEAVEKWAKEHPPKKYNVSQLEYDILKSYLDYKNHMTVDIADYFFEDGLLLSLLKKGHFKGATKEMLIKDYLNDCEVA